MRHSFSDTVSPIQKLLDTCRAAWCYGTEGVTPIRGKLIAANDPVRFCWFCCGVVGFGLKLAFFTKLRSGVVGT